MNEPGCGTTHVKFNVEFIFQEIVNVPTLAKPLGSFFVRFQSEPIRVGGFVILNILKREGILILQQKIARISSSP